MMKRRTILLKLEYCGTDFVGWQMQANHRTVQGELADKLRLFLRHDVKITGSGRTDSGVHALAQYANFETNSAFRPVDIIHKLNLLLPKDIAVLECREVADHFDSRRDAIQRTYRYKICERPNAVDREFSWVLRKRYDISHLRRLSELIKTSRHFDNFCKTKSRRENNNCIIYESRWIRRGGFLVYEISANRFLHHMVRLLVGAMIAVLEGLISDEHFELILKNKIDEKAKYIAPACGLYLAEVGYERGSL